MAKVIPPVIPVVGLTNNPSVTTTGTTEQDGILWNPGGSGPSAVTGTKSYKSKSSSKALFQTGALPKSQMNMINNAYSKYGKSLGFKKASSFWEAIVDSSDAATSPFQVLSALSTEDMGDIAGAGTDGPSTAVSVQQYDQEMSNTLLDSTLLATFGRKATDVEKKRFFKELNTSAKAGTVTKTVTKGGKRITTTTQKFDQRAFIDKYTGTVLEGMVAGKDAIDFGGEAGKIQDTLRKYSNDMGVIRSDRDILSDVRRVINGETTAEDAAMEVRKQAAALYVNFAPRLNADPTLTVRDLMNPYIKLMADTFEQDMESISLTNPTIQTLLASDKTPSYGEFYKQLRGMTEFRNTTTAQKEASTFASGLASAMGF